MNKPRVSFTRRPASWGSRVGMHGVVKITNLTTGQVTCVNNLETDYVLQAISKALSGESAIPASGAGSIAPVSMAIGSGTSPVTASDSALSSELLRKAVTVVRAGNKVTYKVTLTSGEALGTIGCLGLFGSDTGTGSTATGSITLAGTPHVGELVKVTLDGRGIPPYYLGSTTASINATGLAAWLNGDGDFGALYTCSATGAVVSITSLGKGTVYNANVGVSTTGTVTATISGITGGTTPGGQLLAAANTYFRKERNTQLLIEWTISVSN